MCLYENGVSASECLQRSFGVLCPLKLESQETVSPANSSPLKTRQSSSLLSSLFTLLHISSKHVYLEIFYLLLMYPFIILNNN